ncbi:hypothetical protein GCM10023085_18100 [Actinomadura viridis]|uniref:DUF917 family protein n=1 Tax=Actinomadura viridis TaxID=58110 RepID=A0A931GJ87_9ACTN|nr:DUF917 domain-containing protein [Actinomadura viridis]MBG6089433.1 DUF917 family protein [Actinomadura viridis]
MPLLDQTTLPVFARGCAVLGSGGGGGIEVALAAALQAVDDHGPVTVVQPEDLADAALVMPCGLIGSPEVVTERIGGDTAPAVLRDTLEGLLGTPVAALMSSEIGGTNGCLAASWAARLGLPLMDADGMGRAFPGMNQNAMEVAGLSPTPCVLTDERGRTVVLDHIDGRWLERLARGVLDAFGGQAATCEYPLRAGQVRRAAVPGSVTRALAIGAALAGGVPDDPPEGLTRLITGKIAAVQRTVEQAIEQTAEPGTGTPGPGPCLPTLPATTRPGRPPARPPPWWRDWAPTAAACCACRPAAST